MLSLWDELYSAGTRGGDYYQLKRCAQQISVNEIDRVYVIDFDETQSYCRRHERL